MRYTRVQALSWQAARETEKRLLKNVGTSTCTRCMYTNIYMCMCRLIPEKCKSSKEKISTNSPLPAPIYVHVHVLLISINLSFSSSLKDLFLINELYIFYLIKVKEVLLTS